jgi:hypothetical protein
MLFLSLFVLNPKRKIKLHKHKNTHIEEDIFFDKFN